MSVIRDSIPEDADWTVRDSRPHQTITELHPYHGTTRAGLDGLDSDAVARVWPEFDECCPLCRQEQARGLDLGALHERSRYRSEAEQIAELTAASFPTTAAPTSRGEWVPSGVAPSEMESSVGRGNEVGVGTETGGLGRYDDGAPEAAEPVVSEVAVGGASVGGTGDAESTCSKLYATRSLPLQDGSAAAQGEPNHPAAPVAALAEGTASTQGRRRPRDASLRTRIIQVRCNDDEYARIRARAEAGGVSPPRLLVEVALLGPAAIAERHAVKETLLLIRRQLVGIGVNINQLAHWANGRQQLPPGLASSLAAVERMETRVSDLVEALGRS
jgi:hypothetical protein